MMAFLGLCHQEELFYFYGMCFIFIIFRLWCSLNYIFSFLVNSYLSENSIVSAYRSDFQTQHPDFVSELI